MEPSDSKQLKRVKTNSKSKKETKELEFNFDLFLGDLQEDDQPLRGKHTRDFYSLFEETNGTAKTSPRFTQIDSVVLLTFAVSRELLQPLLEKGFPVILASDCSMNIEDAILQVDAEFPNFIKFFPRKKFFAYSSSSFHPKLMLIKFKSFLRVVIGSGNLLEQDWIVWENAFVTRDYPLTVKAKPSEFSKQIDEYLSFVFGDKMDFVQSFAGLKISEFEMKESQFCLVSSLPGRWKNDEPQKYGVSELRRILGVHPPQTAFTLENMSVYYLTSSLGALNWKLITDFASSFLAKPFAKLKPSFEEKEQIIGNFNVIFPSQKFVENSKFGTKSASCLFLDKDNFESFKFQKRAMKQYRKNSEKHNLVSHVKLFLVSNSGSAINDDTVIYVGSHNFTSAAWGRFEHDRTAVFVNNYELGIVIPPMKNSAKAKQKLVSKFDINFEVVGFGKYDEPYFSKR